MPGKPVADLFNSASDVVLKITHYVMEVAPFGVFALVAHTAASQGLEALQAILTLIVAVYLGLIVHAVLTYGILIRVILNLPVVRFFRGLTDPIAVAYSTASSSATLPVTIAAASDNLGVKKSVAGSVLPLGATINMDGTALYLGILALFAAQAFGYDLTFMNYVMIAFTAAIVSIGAGRHPLGFALPARHRAGNLRRDARAHGDHRRLHPAGGPDHGHGAHGGECHRRRRRGGGRGEMGRRTRRGPLPRTGRDLAHGRTPVPSRGEPP